MAAALPAMQKPAPRWQARLERFWRWWSGELLALVPERFANLAGRARAPLIALDANGITVVGADGKPGERADLAGLDAARASAAVRALLERAGESRGGARLGRGGGEALVRRVSLPAATEENLAEVLAFEMDRLTPFRAEEVYFDHRVAGRDAASGTVTVVLGLARREVVDAQLARLRDLGVSVQGVAVPDGAARPGPVLDVLPTAERGRRASDNERTVLRVLFVAVILLAILATALPLWRKRQAIIALHPVVERAEAESRATEALIRDLERQVADYNFALAKKHTHPPVLAYLEDISRLLPDNTWLQQLDIKSSAKVREVQMSGETASASKLIEILEPSKLLRNPTPRGTVTRGTQPGTERFVIAAEMVPQAAPDPVPADAIAATSPTPSAPPKPATAAAPPKPAAVAPSPPPAAASPPAKPAAPTTKGAPAAPAPAAKQPATNLPPAPSAGAAR